MISAASGAWNYPLGYRITLKVYKYVNKTSILRVVERWFCQQIFYGAKEMAFLYSAEITDKNLDGHEQALVIAQAHYVI